MFARPMFGKCAKTKHMVCRSNNRDKPHGKMLKNIRILPGRGNCHQ